MRKYEVFKYIHEPLCGNDIPISLGFVFMTGKAEDEAIEFPRDICEECELPLWGYSYVGE